MEQSYEQILELRLKNKPKTAEIFEKINRLIREQLDDEQKKRFDELVVVFKKKRQAWEKRFHSQKEKVEQ